MNNFFFFFEKNINLISNTNYLVKYNTQNNVLKYNRLNKSVFISKILSLFFKNGNYKSNLINFYHTIYKLSYYFYNNNTSNVLEIRYNFNSMLNYNNFLFLLKWSLENLSCTFNINVKQVPKKYKKKSKNNFNFNIKYVFKKFRNKVKLKLLRNFYYTSQKNFKLNYYRFFFELLLNYKNSTLFLNKIKIYNKLLN